MAETVAQFAARIKSKYPDYAEVPDRELVERIVAKHPDYASQVDMGESVSVKLDFNPEEHEANLNAGGQTRVDTPMGGKAVIPLANPLMEQAKEFLGAPGRMLGGMVDMAKDIGRMDEPLDQKLLGYGKAAVGGLGDALGKLVYGSPVEQAGVAGDIATGLATGSAGRGGRAVAKGLENRSLSKSLKSLYKAENQIMYAQGAESVPEWNATFRNAIPEIAPEVRKMGKALDSHGWSVATGRAKKSFYEKNVKPLEQQLSGVAVDNNQIGDDILGLRNQFLEINKPGEIKKLENLAASFKKEPMILEDLLDLRKFANDELEKMGYNSKSIEVQERMRTRPDVQRALAQRNSIIKVIDDTIDANAPRSASTRDIMRKFRDLTTVANTAEERARQVYAQTRAQAGKGFDMSVGPFFSGKGAAAQGVRISAKLIEKGRNHPDVVMKKATHAMLKGKGGFGGEALPIRELPRPLSGPILPDDSGVKPMGPQGLATVFDEMMDRSAPKQLALPPASIKLPGTFDVVPPTGGNYPKSSSMTTPATPDSTTRLFRGDIRGGYGMADPAQQAEKRRALLGKPYIDSEGHIKYRK